MARWAWVAALAAVMFSACGGEADLQATDVVPEEVTGSTNMELRTAPAPGLNCTPTSGQVVCTSSETVIQDERVPLPGDCDVFDGNRLVLGKRVELRELKYRITTTATYASSGALLNQVASRQLLSTRITMAYCTLR